LPYSSGNGAFDSLNDFEALYLEASTMIITAILSVMKKKSHS